ncbi:MAG: glycosyltransferase, partial [Chloroflexi bacterium]|nr:glycosyltransferase [Chloroflexota bacterium]
FWNANNTFGFDRIDWRRLGYTTTLTTVSRYMKHIMQGIGLNPLVIPNGIPESLLVDVPHTAVSRLRKGLGADLILSKVARWDPDKRWNTAVEAMARLKASGQRAVLLARGGIEPHGQEVMQGARSLGLVVKDLTAKAGGTTDDYVKSVGSTGVVDVLNLRFHCPQDFLRVLYRASNAVLANSVHEPFGLVGLETMAAGGIAFTGGTGEDYALSFRNCIVLETPDPAEIEAYVMYLEQYPEERERIRREARHTAKQFVWPEVVGNLVQKLEYQARLQGLLAAPRKHDVPAAQTEAVAPERHTVLAGNKQSASCA